MNEHTKKVLCIIDMQNDFLTGSLGGEHCRKAIPHVVELLEKDKWDKVFLTCDTHFEDSYSKSLEGKKLPVLHCVEHTWGHKVCDEITNVVNKLKHSDQIPPDDELFHPITKYTFGSECLVWNIGNLRENCSCNQLGADLEIHMCGVCTSICVLANAVLLRANYPSAKIVIHADACGDVNEEMHQHALACLKAQQCDIV